MGEFQSLFLKMAVNRLFFTPTVPMPALSGGNCIAIHCPVTRVISPVQKIIIIIIMGWKNPKIKEMRREGLT